MGGPGRMSLDNNLYFMLSIYLFQITDKLVHKLSKIRIRKADLHHRYLLFLNPTLKYVFTANIVLISGFILKIFYFK